MEACYLHHQHHHHGDACPRADGVAHLRPGRQAPPLCSERFHPAVSLPIHGGPLLRPVDPLYKPHPQVVVSLLVFNLLHLLNLVPLRGYSRALGERLLVPAVCDGAQAVLATWAQAKGSVDGDGLFPLALRLLPLVAAGWSHALRLAAPPSARLTGLVAMLSVGVSLAVTGRGPRGAVLVVDPLEYLYAPLSLVLQGLALTWLAKVSEAERHHRRQHQQRAVSSVDLYYTHLVNQSVVLGLLGLLHPDGPWRALSEGSWCCLLFHGYLLALLLLGAALHFTLDLTALRCSPLAAAALHSAARELTGPLLSLFDFRH